jgi:hypothetical protein
MESKEKDRKATSNLVTSLSALKYDAEKLEDSDGVLSALNDLGKKMEGDKRKEIKNADEIPSDIFKKL